MLVVWDLEHRLFEDVELADERDDQHSHGEPGVRLGECVSSASQEQPRKQQEQPGNEEERTVPPKKTRLGSRKIKKERKRTKATMLERMLLFQSVCWPAMMMIRHQKNMKEKKLRISSTEELRFTRLVERGERYCG